MTVKCEHAWKFGPLVFLISVILFESGIGQSGKAIRNEHIDPVRALSWIQNDIHRDKIRWEAFTIPVYGIALLSTRSTTRSGQYAKEIRILRDRTLQILNKELHRGRGSAWFVALSTWFLSVVYRTDPTDAVRESLCRTVEALEQSQVSAGGWGHYIWTEKDKTNIKEILVQSSGYPYDMVASTNCVFLALQQARLAGFKVRGAVLDSALEYYLRAQKTKTGGFVYGIQNYAMDRKDRIQFFHRGREEVGRTAAATVVLDQLGYSAEPLYSRAVRYFTTDLSEIISGHGGPGIHLLFAGFACYLAGKESWNSYLGLLDRWVEQKSNGSVVYRDKKFADTYCGNALTGIVVLTLNIPQGRVLRMKPPAQYRRSKGDRQIQGVDVHIKALVRSRDAEKRWRAVVTCKVRDMSQIKGAVIPLLKDPCPRIRKTVLEVLALLQMRQYSRLVSRRLHDRDPQVREAAIKTLDACGDHRYKSRIAALLSDRDAHVRRQAIRTLHSFNARKYSIRIAKLLDDRDIWVRGLAAEFLGRLGSENHVDKIVTILDGENVWVKALAMDALSHLESNDPFDEIVRILVTSKDPWMKGCAILALGRMKAGLSHIVKHVKFWNADVRCCALIALKWMNAHEQAPLVASALKDKNPTVRGHAILTLGSFRAGRYESQIESCLSDEGLFDNLYDHGKNKLGITKVMDIASMVLKKLRHSTR